MSTPGQPVETPDLQGFVDTLGTRVPDAVLGSSADGREASLRVRKESLPAVLRVLKADLGFNALQDMIAMDRLTSMREGEKRFAVLYQLYRFPGGERLRVVVEVGEGESIGSATAVYRAADWAEREIFDMFGLVFEGHPGLRRIYLPDEFDGHPLRKDFPLEGRNHGL
jgi:NADH-quinone oxidoreductase subunit C